MIHYRVQYTATVYGAVGISIIPGTVIQGTVYSGIPCTRTVRLRIISIIHMHPGYHVSYRGT